MRLPAVLAVAAPPLLTSACTPTMRYGDARVASEDLLVETAETGQREERRGIWPERLRMHLSDPSESNWPSQSRIFYVDLGQDCRLMARLGTTREDGPPETSSMPKRSSSKASPAASHWTTARPSPAP